MDWLLMNVLARFVNADRIGSWCRALVAAVTPWILLRIPFLQGWLSPELEGTIATALSAFLVGVWSDFSKTMSAPTALQVEKVATAAADAGIIPSATATVLIDRAKGDV